MARKLFLVATIIVILSIGVRATIALRPYIAQPNRDLTEDVDWGYINTGLDRMSSFTDTARWWTGTWCGEVPFWRPLTSYAYWGMRLLWPPEYMLPRQAVLVFLHLCFVVTAGLLLWRLTRRPWLVLLTLWLFAGVRPHGMGQPQVYILPVDDMLLDPKNLPDPLVGIAILASLLFLTNGRWAAGLVAAIASVGFKEVGFTTWPLALVMLVWLHREHVMAAGGARYVISSIRRNWLPVATWLLALGLLVAIHFLAVGMGFTEGSNKLWYGRMAMFFGWPVLANLLLFDRTAALLACLVFAAVVALRRSSLSVRFLGALGALAIGIALDAWFQGTTWDVSATRILFFGHGLRTTLLCLAWLLIAWVARHDWRTILLVLTMAFVAAFPSWMAAQTWAHTRYTAWFFTEAVVAAALCQNAKALAGIYTRKKVPNGSATAG